MKKILIATLVCLFVLSSSATAKAVIIAPNTFNVTAVSGTLPTSMTLLETINTSWAHSLVTGTLLHQVYRDDSDNTLLFMYQVGNDPNLPPPGQPHDSLYRVTATNFTDWTTDVFYVSTSVIPETFDRSLTGSTIGFDFSGDRIEPSESSVQLWVKTDAEFYGPGEVSIIDGGAVNVDVYGPAIPEPASMLLLGVGLIGLAGGKIRKRFKA